MALTSKQRKYLKALAHHLKPVVQVGNAGISDAVVDKVGFELEHHELIKVKVGDAPLSAKEAGPELAARSRSELCQVIGRTVVLYRRRREDPTIVLPGS
jgi:RNA-binding protein